ncbi:MAG TPA: hypothetical protein VM821_01235 [Abditibacteriaceae bacterium]|jgi:hypothetical protein|nr:hypothetical protein [Abditibacteriaceae bacterium]
MITLVFADFEKKAINFEPSLHSGFGGDIVYNGDEIPEDTENSGRYLDGGIGEIIVDLDEVVRDLGAIPLAIFVEANHKAVEEPEVWSKAEEWFPLDVGIKTLSELLICL